LSSLSAILCLPIAIAFATIANAETDQTIKAFSVWEARGGLQTPGTEANTYSATIIGHFYVDTDKGPVDAGIISCPLVVRVMLSDRSQSGSGTCTISGRDGGQVLLKLACTGIYRVGCSGEATIVEGTDRFAGVTGGGKFTIRSDLAEPATAASTSAKEPVGAMPSDIGGILFFDEFRYKLP